MEAVNGCVAAKVARAARAARYTGPLLIVLVSASCGIASICKVGRDPSVNLITEGVEALPRLGAVAESLQLRTGGCSGCTKVGTCRPLAKLYQEAGDRRELYCQHGGYGS
ncbi:hypothetical protein [Streptomyces sp. ADMS]|uniref:hypothetical protein n=1 Tax=Streptomyces sp. ADMS TaxID=3071415 RepID=UPI0039925923